MVATPTHIRWPSNGKHEQAIECWLKSTSIGFPGQSIRPLAVGADTGGSLGALQLRQPTVYNGHMDRQLALVPALAKKSWSDMYLTTNLTKKPVYRDKKLSSVEFFGCYSLVCSNYVGVVSIKGHDQKFLCTFCMWLFILAPPPHRRPCIRPWAGTVPMSGAITFWQVRLIGMAIAQQAKTKKKSKYIIWNKQYNVLPGYCYSHLDIINFWLSLRSTNRHTIQYFIPCMQHKHWYM